MTDIHAKIAENIKAYGVHVTGVMSDPTNGRPAFAYTIGNALVGLPELLLIGNFEFKVAGAILNILTERMREVNAPLDGLTEYGAQFPALVRRAGPDAADDWALHIGSYLGHDEFEILQVLMCDPAGCYPGDPLIDPRYDVPLL